MHWIDWTIIGLYLVWIIVDGLRMTKHSGELEGYFLASRSLPWWAVGLSVMATQLSAITMIGTTGQGYQSGMALLQQYYALPIAMIILSVTLVPFFHNAHVYTAYEYVERRFDAKTRAFTAFLSGASVRHTGQLTTLRRPGENPCTTCRRRGIR